MYAKEEAYKELGRREKREKQLQVARDKLQVNVNLMVSLIPVLMFYESEYMDLSLIVFDKVSVMSAMVKPNKCADLFLRNNGIIHQLLRNNYIYKKPIDLRCSATRNSFENHTHTI